MDHFFRIVLCTCLCLGALQATPVRSNAAKQQCTIDKDDVLFELNNVLCVSRGAKDHEMCLWVVGFFTLLLKQEQVKGIAHPEVNFSLCLQENVTFSSPTNVKVRAPFRWPESRSKMPQTTCDRLLCGFSPPAAGLPRERREALHRAAHLSGQQLQQHRLHHGQYGRAGRMHCAAGEFQRCDKHLMSLGHRKQHLNSARPLQANCSLTLRSHNTFERFTSALEIFVEEFNYLRMKWIQPPSTPPFNFILT